VRATRLVSPDDAEVLAEVLATNREHLAPYEPDRPPDFLTVDAQHVAIEAALERHAQATALPHVILDESGRLVGRITLNEIVRGPFQSANLGYWLAESATGRGLATAAVREIQRIAFTDLGLHRIQAGTLPENIASQRVLERTGFVRFGLAPAYLHIAGAWRDHVLYQALSG
jgi:[ribosomal protein S5]-alanine N-acetyltransferase